MEKQIKARIQHKIDTYAHWSLAKNFVPYEGELIIYTTDENGDKNIGLKIGDGVKNVIDLDFLTLPSNGQAVAPGASQIQTDYNQNDDNQIDYIKNRPFYSLPPEHSFNFRGVKKFNSITWDGNISNNPLELNVTPVEFMGGMRFFKVAEQTLNFDDILNSTLYITAPIDIGEDIEVNYAYYALRITSDMILYQDTNFLISEYFIEPIYYSIFYFLWCLLQVI